jgi:hypothetical protein
VAPRCHKRTGRSTRKEKEVLLWARMRGSMAPRVSPPGRRRPVNTALPRLAEIPQKKVAVAMHR